MAENRNFKHSVCNIKKMQQKKEEKKSGEIFLNFFYMISCLHTNKT